MSSHAKKSASTQAPVHSPFSSLECEQRLDVLTAKVDMLLAAFGLSEGAADVRWRTVAGAGIDQPVVSLSAQIGNQFAAARIQRDSLRQALTELKEEWTPECEVSADAKLSPLSHRLFSLAHELAAVPAGETGELRFKALALQEYCEENSDDVVHLLAASLATDILTRGL